MPRDENTILAELLPIFRRVFEDDEVVITRETTAHDVDGWNSLTHMSLISSVESHYGIKFKLAEIVRFKNVGDMCGAILRAKP
jgi:acyl carrier protein